MKLHRMKRHIFNFIIMSTLLSAANFTGEPRLANLMTMAMSARRNLPARPVMSETNPEYTISGSGTNMWFVSDEFHFVWKKMNGNFILRTRVKFIGKGAVEHRKVGWMVRPKL